MPAIALQAPASSAELNKFVQTVDEFMRKYAVLVSPATRAAVYATQNPTLIADYETAVSRGRLLRANIEAVTGAWVAARKIYAAAIDQSSMWIGDAIDEVRSWFGYRPGGMNGLGALQIPAAVWVVGTIAAAAVLISTMNKIFVVLEASKIQRENPGMTREQALSQANDAFGLSLFGGMKWPAIIGLGVLAYLMVK